VRLLQTCGPSAIIGRIAAIVVDTFDSHALWTRGHISHEVSHVAPAPTDANTSGSIPLKGNGLRFVASGDHVDPYPVERSGPRQTVSFSHQIWSISSCNCR
jgi:hypothetical protein